GDLSFLNAIPAIGNKFMQAERVSPSGRKNVVQRSSRGTEVPDYTVSVWLRAGAAPDRYAPPEVGARLRTLKLASALVPLGAGPKPARPVFDRVLLLEPKAETSANVSAGDVNGDGKLDL